jgi:hypothetical protein
MKDKKKQTKAQMISEIRSDILACRHQLGEINTSLYTQMGRMDHHFSNIMIEVQGLAKASKTPCDHRSAILSPKKGSEGSKGPSRSITGHSHSTIKP